MTKLSVSIFGQTTGYIIYTVSREPITLPEIHYPDFFKDTNEEGYFSYYTNIFLGGLP